MLSTGGGQRSKDLPGSRAFLGFVTTGDLACDDRRAQLAFGQVVGGSDDIEGEQLGGKNPQPPARAGDPPAGLITVKCRCLAQFGGDGVVLGLDFDSEPIEGLREATGTELQAKTIAQNGAAFAHGKPFGLVEIGSQSQGAGSELDAGRADGP